MIWSCPRCTEMARTVDSKLPMHRCVGMAGLLVPLTREGEKTHQVAVDREDYVNGEDVQRDANGRPVMAVQTHHHDGSADCTIYAPAAGIKAKGQDL